MHALSSKTILSFFLVKLETNCHTLNLLVCKTGQFDIVVNFWISYVILIQDLVQVCSFVFPDETETFQLHSIRNYWIISPIYLEIVIFMTPDSVGGRNRSFYTNRKMSIRLQIHYYDVKFNYFFNICAISGTFFIFNFLGTKLSSFVKTQFNNNE